MLDKLQKSVGDILEFPPEVTGDGAKITITGRREILVEKFEEVLTIEPDHIRLRTADGELSFHGKRFMLKTLLPTELRIGGELDSLVFEQGGKG